MAQVFAEMFFTGASNFIKQLVQHNIFLSKNIVPNTACQAAPDSGKITASSKHHSIAQWFPA